MRIHRLAAGVAAAALVLAAGRAPAGAACPDCDGNGTVAINELITGVAIALGDTPLAACPSFDRSADGAVTVDELIGAINFSLSGCAATPTPTVSPTPTHLDPGPPPTAPDALLVWLQAGNYGAWAAESAPHQSAGPHGGRVRTFINPALFDSLTEGRTQHPAGAVAVKELYLNSQQVRGWAVMVKLADDSDGGRNWYWYEYFGSGDPFSGNGLGICTGCHSAGRDYVRIPFPLQ